MTNSRFNLFLLFALVSSALSVSAKPLMSKNALISDHFLEDNFFPSFSAHQFGAPTPDAGAQDNPPPQLGGNTGTPCHQDPTICNSPRKCVTQLPSGAFQTCSASSPACFCIDEDNLFCQSSSDCLRGDRCFVSSSGHKICIACLFPQTSSVDDGKQNCQNGGNGDPDETKACIAVNALQHFSPSSLVFKQHRRATVLCDDHDNCATPGHIVVYKSVSMMMSSYCQQPLVSCIRRVMFVNSPRMKTGLRIPSRSDHLQFTALAARFESALEEKVLSVLSRAGL